MIKGWLYSPGCRRQGIATPTDDSPGTSHGSCVASKALGRINGVSKDAQLIVVKTTYPELNSYVAWAFYAVDSDIKYRRQRGGQPAVVVFAGGANQDSTTYPWLDVGRSMEEIFSQGAAIVVSAGNQARECGRQDVDKIPATWADTDDKFPLIVAGAVDNTGALTPFSQGPTHVTVWAPGCNVQCANRGSFRKASGTSPAAGMVGNPQLITEVIT